MILAALFWFSSLDLRVGDFSCHFVIYFVLFRGIFRELLYFVLFVHCVSKVKVRHFDPDQVSSLNTSSHYNNSLHEKLDLPL
jgi:hypothetical protein